MTRVSDGRVDAAPQRPREGSVRRGQGLGALDVEGDAVAGEGAGSAFGAEQLEAELFLRVALADERAVAESRVDRARRGLVGTDQRGTTAPQLDLDRWSSDHDHLCLAHGAHELRPRLQFHRCSPPRGRSPAYPGMVADADAIVRNGQPDHWSMSPRG